MTFESDEDYKEWHRRHYGEWRARVRKEGVPKVDRELFTWLGNTYSAAAQLNMGVKNPVVPGSDEIQNAAADRGLSAVIDEIGTMKDRISFDQAQAYCMRILHFGQIMRNVDAFSGDLIRRGGTPGELEISDAVMHGAARGKLEEKRGALVYDIKDVVRLAQKYADKHP